MALKIYVEGGSEDQKAPKDACRKGFVEFLQKAGFEGKMPQIVACGSRDEALRQFERAKRSGDNAWLLIDSEQPIAAKHQQGETQNWQSWGHLPLSKPALSNDNQCHFMVVVMESWLLSDRETLKKYYGKNFKENALPNEAVSIETLTKDQIYKSLEQATQGTQKGKYSKGGHSFDLLEKIDPQKVIEKSPWAKRFIECLRDEMRA